MLDRLRRSFRGEPAAEPVNVAASGISQRRLDGLRRSAAAELATPPRRPSPAVAIPPLSEVKTLAGGTAEDLRAVLGEVLSVENEVLRRYFSASVTDGPLGPEEYRQRQGAAFSSAFADEPFAVAMDLYARFPARRRLGGIYASDQIRRVCMAFDAALSQAMRAALAAHGTLPFTDAQLARSIQVVGQLIAAGDHDSRHQFDNCYLQIVRAASADDWPKWRDPLIAAFSRAFTGRSHDHRDVVVMVERLLKETPLGREEIPELVADDGSSARLDAIRDAIRRELGEPLGAALEAVLDAQGYLEPKNVPALAALRELSPEERGRAFVSYLDILGGLDRHGLQKWGELKRENGRYRFGIEHQAMPFEMSFPFKQLTRRRIALPEADRTVSRFLDLLPALIHLSDRKVLELVLDTAREAPDGQTAAKLRALIAADMGNHPLKDFRLEIEDALRFLPAAGADAVELPVNSAPEPVPRAAELAGPRLLHGLPPLPLPEVDLSAYAFRLTLQRHFDNSFDARIYDAAHRDLLDRLARVHEAVSAPHAGDEAITPGRIAQIARDNGFATCEAGLAQLFAAMILDTVELAAQIRERIEVFAPFVAQFPEQARSLSRLVQDLGSKSFPSRKWMVEGRAALDGIAPELHVAMIEELFEKSVPGAHEVTGDATLRTLIYLAVNLDPQLIAPRLVRHALRNGYAKQTGHGVTPGMKSERAGNACVWTLSEMPGGAGIPFLARLQRRVNYPKVRTFIDKRLDAAAENAGITRAELDEQTVPAHGLGRDGWIAREVADGQAMIRLDGSQVVIDWLGEGGRTLKGPSAAMKAQTDALKAIRTLAGEIRADLSVQADRLQRLYLENRDWPVEQWQQRYCAHPLVGALARRLVWWLAREHCPPVAVLPDPDGGRLLAVDGQEIDSAGARVRLWHPIEAAEGEIEAWRARLETLQTVQPFAQVWREVYLLTDAERETGTYSNRWAAHVLRQHQAMELARANGWRVTHRVGYDVRNDDPWHVTLAAHGLVAEYWVEGLGGEHAEFSPGGAFSYIATDRLQFHRIAGQARDSARGPQRGDAVQLTEVPPLVFSEVMRQADLFTSVASIGNDPAWLDGGAGAEHPAGWRREADNYWHRANAADLEVSARYRRALLERTIGRLKIADRLALDERHLLVEGTLNRYRIHLGSGGAFLGERHLCIVPKSEAAAGRVWLPFEGDRTLSIILSKALLLAADDKITDPVILGQIGSR
jgi:hypothetical protein